RPGAEAAVRGAWRPDSRSWTILGTMPDQPVAADRHIPERSVAGRPARHPSANEDEQTARRDNNYCREGQHACVSESTGNARTLQAHRYECMHIFLDRVILSDALSTNRLHLSSPPKVPRGKSSVTQSLFASGPPLA